MATPKQTVPFALTATGTGVAQDLVVTGDNAHRFSADTYPAFGGQDASPSPLAYVLGGLTSCNQVTGSIVANELGLNLGAWTVTIQGDLDPSVLAGGAQGNANFDKVTVRVTVETDAADADFDKLVSETERRCPVSQMFIRSGLEWDSVWTKAPLPVGVS